MLFLPTKKAAGISFAMAFYNDHIFLHIVLVDLTLILHLKHFPNFRLQSNKTKPKLVKSNINLHTMILVPRTHFL